MRDESRPLWEQLDSEVEPWRRGRGILICLAAFYIVAQSLILAASILLGNIERFLIFGVGTVFFWLLFYLVWIGVHWIRWLLGGWNLIIGFCFAHMGMARHERHRNLVRHDCPLNRRIFAFAVRLFFCH
jgi:hypothetical protein